MNETKEKKVLLSLRNVEVKFNVRGRILTAIRNVSLDIYEDEALAIVGESGSGKSVLTKTFAGMLDANGFIPQGSIIFSDDELSKTDVKLTARNRRTLRRVTERLNRDSRLERGAAEYRAILEKEAAMKRAKGLTIEEEEDFAARIKEVTDDIVDRNNYLMALSKKSDAEEYAKTTELIKTLTAKRDAIEREKSDLIRRRASEVRGNTALAEENKRQIDELRAAREKKIATPEQEGNPYGLSDAVLERNKIIGYEVLLSIGRYPLKDQIRFVGKLSRGFRDAMRAGEDLKNPAVLNRIFETVAFRVEYRSIDEEAGLLHGYAIIDCAKVKYTKDWQEIRGCRIATVFQDPMTSLNTVLTIG